MNADLEQTLNELGPDYRKVVDRLLSPVEQASSPAHRSWWRTAALLAASLVIGLGIAWHFSPTEGEQAGTPALRESPYVLAYSTDASAVDALVRTQRADGSWANDFLTRQNAAALRAATGESARVAYRRAVRYLRAKGLAPLTAAELREREVFAARQLKG